ncbi:MAG: hypothetical protein DSY79_07825 [Chloroflexi bacterium]|nr:MAG: hypothetical protein DSY79_07825 [Chloroflexota bacterium]HIM69233.1 carboxymuconolactone decarboxylase family protein [Gammaproteobacteria bacterium]
MALLPYVQDDTSSREVQVLFQHCRSLLGRVANAIRVAAHTPRVAQSLVGFMVAALRTEVSGVLDMRIKALVILKTSTLNGCAYCVGHNTALGRSLGFQEDEIEAISQNYQLSDYFSPADKAAIHWAECLTERTYKRHPEVMAQLKLHFNDAQIVEITMVSGFFNFWNRFTDALEIDIESSDSVGNIQRSKTVDVEDYVKYMRDCWWNDGAYTREAPE